MDGSIRTVIVDDEALARDLLRSLLGKYPEFEVIGEAADGRSAVALINELKPDLAFLDIQMPGMTGLDVVHNLDNWFPQLLFVTAYDEYAVEAFDVCAIDYLLKPIQKGRFYEAIDRVKDRVRHSRLTNLTNKMIELSDKLQTPNKPNNFKLSDARDADEATLTVRIGNRVVGILDSQIHWIEAANQYVRLHTQKGNFVMCKSMQAMHEKLDPNKFFRIHRSSIVNREYIRRICPLPRGRFSVELSTGRKLIVSYNRRNLIPHLVKNLE